MCRYCDESMGRPQAYTDHPCPEIRTLARTAHLMIGMIGKMAAAWERERNSVEAWERALARKHQE